MDICSDRQGSEEIRLTADATNNKSVKNLWQIKNNNVQHKRITSREDNYIRQRDLFAVANSVVVAEILAKFSALTVTNIQYEKFSSVMQTLFSEGF